MKKTTLSLIMASMLAACASQKTNTAPPAPVESKKEVVTPAPAPAPEIKPLAVDPRKDPANILSKRSVYYDFDKSNVKDEFKPMIKAHADYLSSHAAANTVLQGNCDERGSREYNIALGQRRADGVKKLMEASGASSKQIDTVSFGKEKPKAEGHDEAAWAQNRRTDITYKDE